MSEVTKNNVMKSTLKIKLSERHDGNVPIIKIVQPLELNSYNQDPSIDVDVNDTLISNFLRTPLSSNRNRWFTLSGFYNTPFDNPSHHITTIEPINNFKNLLTGIRSEILNNLIPYSELEMMHESIQKVKNGSNGPVSTFYDKYKTIIDFFEWALQQDEATLEE